MKKILAGLLIGAMLAVPASAEIQTYSDDYISFEYDDEMLGEIIKRISYDLDYDHIEYSVSTRIKSNQESGTTVRMMVTSSPNIIESLFTEGDNDEYTITLESDDPLTSRIDFKAENGGTNFCKVLAKRNDQYVITIIATSELDSERYNVCKHIVDSVVVSDNFIENGYIPKDTDDSRETEEIFYNLRLSEQGIKYAQAALDICNQYLDIEISGKEASDKIEELRNRVDSYKDSSDYYADSDIYYAIFNTNVEFLLGNDAKIIETRDELQRMVDCGTDE